MSASSLNNSLADSPYFLKGSLASSTAIAAAASFVFNLNRAGDNSSALILLAYISV